MRVLLDLDISPLSSFMGKILPMELTEDFLFKHFATIGSEHFLQEYYALLDTKSTLVEPHNETLVYILTILEKIILRNVPNNRLLLISSKIINVNIKSKRIVITIEYCFK